MKSISNLTLILGNQLFHTDTLKANLKNTKETVVFMREDVELCTYYKFHKHKIVFFLSAMRTYCKELEDKGFHVHYEELSPHPSTFESALLNYIRKNKITSVSFFEIEDKFFEKRIVAMLAEAKISTTVWPSPMFLTTRADFKSYVQKNKRPFMKVFYEAQRKRLEILIEKSKEPVGGRWSFDSENRLPLPSKIQPPDLPIIRPSKTTTEVQLLTESQFKDHPGTAETFWLPTTRKEALHWLDQFLDERLAQFGPYEDAIPQHSDFVFHSVLTPFLNTGLLTPKEVVGRTLAVAKKNKTSIASVEGFIRQVIGWREFIRGIYQNFSEKQEKTNFFNHKRKLSDHWYRGDTGVTPLDHAIRKVIKYGYAHHIERLMIIGSLMLLLEIHPHEAHRWFMEMFIDSSDWVMGPNVYGMALFSDGGIFATKPYFCGSNYYRKMGGYKANEPWCDAVDGLYWGFIEKNKTLFLKNPRLSMMVRTLEKMDINKKKKIFEAAENLKKKITKS
jgi:deoxyribodipyrimidine photolyase-related protein